jgi:hypothetical protein
VLWLDIPFHIAFGQSLKYIPQPQPKQLTLQDPRVVERYNKILLEFFQKGSLLEKLQAVESRFSTETPTQVSAELEKEYNALDKIRTKGILLANQKCRHLRMGKTPYSPTLVMAWQKIIAWSLLRKFLQGHRVDSRYLARTLKKAGIKRELIMLQECEEQLTTIWKNYKLLKKQAVFLRATWLEEIAAAKADTGNSSTAQELKNLVFREKQRRDARVIKYVTSDHERRGLSSIEVFRNNQWIELTEQIEIEAALLQELDNRFNQACNTPFAVEPLLSDVGALGLGPASLKILDGTYVAPTHIDPWAQKLIPFLKQEVGSEHPNKLSGEDYSLAWKKINEKTSAGPSGITISQMKAHGKDPHLSEVDSVMAHLPFYYGFSPLRWRKGLDIMLEKKKGIRQINTLRAILLYEADFNQNNKRLGREMLYTAEKIGAVAPEQYGSRKNMSAVDQSLNKAITFDLWRQHRQRGALCSNDAKSCYDRIVHNIASLCMQRVGAPIGPIKSMFHTIQSLSHHVRTVFGESVAGFKHKGPTPIQGVGQGNGAGPQIWALVSSPVLNMLRAQGHGATFMSAITRTEMTLVGYSFVDDTDLVTSRPQINQQQVVTNCQQSLTAWEGGICATGGAIEPRKSHWYLVDFTWKDGVPSYKNTTESTGTLEVRDSAGIICPLRQLEPWQAERTLGIRLAPDGR